MSSIIIRHKNGSVIACDPGPTQGQAASRHRQSLAGADLRGWDLRRADLDGAMLDGAILDGARLDEARLRQASLTGASAIKTSLVRAKARLSCWDKSDCTGANFSAARIPDSTFVGATLDQCRFDRAVLDNSVFDGARGLCTGFSDVRAIRTVWRGATLQAPCFEGAVWIDPTHDRPGRVLPADPTAGAVVKDGNWIRSKIPAPYKAFVQDARIGGMLESIPARIVASMIPGPGHMLHLAPVVGSLVHHATEHVAEGVLTRITPPVVRRFMQRAGRWIGFGTAGHAVSDGLHDLGTALTTDRPSLSSAICVAQPDKHAPGALETRVLALSVGDVYRLDKTSGVEQAETLAAGLSGLLQNGPVTFVLPNPGPNEPKAIRVTPEAISVAWFNNHHQRDHSVLYHPHTRIATTWIDKKGMGHTDAQTLEQAPTFLTAITPFCKAINLPPHTVVAPNIAASLGQQPWPKGVDLACRQSLDPEDLLRNIGSLISIAAASCADLHDADGLQRLRRLESRIEAFSPTTTTRVRMDRLIDDGAQALIAAKGPWAQGLSNIGQAILDRTDRGALYDACLKSRREHGKPQSSSILKPRLPDWIKEEIDLSF